MQLQTTRRLLVRSVALLLGGAPLLAAQSGTGGKPPVKPPVKPAAKAPVKTAAKTAPPKPDSAARPVDAPPTPAPAIPMGRIEGMVFDSVHMRVLADAAILLEGSTRTGGTDLRGRFVVDSVPPGSYRVHVDHPFLDSLGLAMTTDTIGVVDGKTTSLVLSIPSSQTLVQLSCPAARRSLGPAAVIGRVLDADTDAPLDSVRVSFAWAEIDLRTLRRAPRTRDVLSGADGVYRICGLPNQLEGTLQAIKKGVTTSEVKILFEGQLLRVQGLRLGNANTVARAEPDTAKRRDLNTGPVFSAPTIQRGNAALTGRVVSANGAPVVGARVDVIGTPGATLTGSNGEFVLNGLPSGTQSLVVRQLGFAPVEQPVELSTRAPARVTVTMSKPATVLDPVVVTAKAEEGLDRVGFTQRKKAYGGTFMTGDDVVKRAPTQLTDVFRAVPGIRVVPVGNEYQIESARNVMGGCVKYWVDGSPWDALFPGDVDRLLPPQEIAAIEVYQGGASVPAQFQAVGNSSCAAIVIWSRTRTERMPTRRR